MLTKYLINKLLKIKLLATDIDGTMTDGSVFYSNDGELIKRFHVRDGMAITLLRKVGIKTAFITSMDSEIVIKRGEKLQVDDVYVFCRDKTSALNELAEKYNIDIDEIAFIGDDVNDLPALEVAGFSAAPADSANLIISNVDYVCKTNGGFGVVREITELILKYQNKDNFLNENW